MSTYAFSSNLPSLNIQKTLLDELESYLEKLSKEIYKDYARKDRETIEEFFKSNFKYVIIDKKGEAEYRSVKEYEYAYLPNDTTELEIKFWCYRKLNITIRFVSTTFFHRSKVSITVESDKSRETVMGIYSEILNIIKPYKNLNFIFHYQVVQFLFLMTFWITPIYLVDSLIHNSDELFVSIVLFLLYSFVGVSFVFKPYSVFYIKKHLAYQKWYEWFIKGLLAFLIFGGLFSFLKDKLFNLLK